MGECYKEAIDNLKMRYDRPRLIHQTQVKKIIEAPALKMWSWIAQASWHSAAAHLTSEGYGTRAPQILPHFTDWIEAEPVSTNTAACIPNSVLMMCHVVSMHLMALQLRLEISLTLTPWHCSCWNGCTRVCLLFVLIKAPRFMVLLVSLIAHHFRKLWVLTFLLHIIPWGNSTWQLS